MSISTLVIGIGGTGVLTLRSLKRLYEELPAEERVPAAFLAFDFDRSALMAADQKGRFAGLEEREFFYLNPKDIQDLLRNLDRSANGDLAWRKILEWFPERSHVQIPASEVEANGASQLRVLGRLGFFQNDEVIESTIRRRLDEIGSEIDQIRLSEDKRVILVSSVAGGTGAGMLIDMAYIARRQAVRPRIFTYVLLPEVFQDVDSGGRIFQNAYACLKELAYLKDQQIPFQAEYYRIPPVDIPAGGEEPFARIYLCKGDGFSGADAVKAATVDMSRSILAQLQRTIQEKTLAIVSNTLSASHADEQQRRRTHNFSTAGSHFIPLRRIEVTRDDLFRVVVQAVQDPSLLEEVYGRDLKSVFDQVEAEAKNGDVALVQAENQARGEKADLSAEDQQARSLERLWGRRLREQSIEAQKWIIDDLAKRLDTVKQTVLRGKKAEVGQAVQDLEKLKALILADFTRESYENNLKALRDLTRFPEYDIGIKKEIQTYFHQLENTLPADDPWRKRALYQKLSKVQGRLQEPFPEAAWPAREKYVQNWQQREKELETLGRIKLFRRAPKELDIVRRARFDCEDLEKAIQDEKFQEHIAAIMKVRAIKELKDWISSKSERLDESLADTRKAWSELPILERIRGYQPPDERRTEILSLVRKELPEILIEAKAVLRREDEPEVRQEKLRVIVERRIKPATGALRNLFKIEGATENMEEDIREALVRCRQKIFEKRTPNPQRKGFGLIMVPEGLHWPDGNLRSFLESAAVQILGCRCQVEDYTGSRIWIYYEELFNPPEHIRNLDEYYRTYRSQRYIELFHIDRRFLANPLFREINSATSTLVVTCGNPGCRENIGTQPRTETLCRACGLPVRSRCGNENCSENNLQSHSKAKEKTCPICGGFNHAAWWICEKHGKVPFEIPIDKKRCSRCIEEHLNDPAAWPESKISVRADLLDSLVCPNCDDMHARDANHESYLIPKPLLRFYRNGVNGHDRDDFLRLAELNKLPDKCRCPKCRTLLIPIHHHELTLRKERRF